MAKLTEAEKEAIYDAERSGAAWLPVLAITDDPTNDGREIPIVRSRDAAHREERIVTILERIAAMDEPKQSEMLGYLQGLLDGMPAD